MQTVFVSQVGNGPVVITQSAVEVGRYNRRTLTTPLVQLALETAEQVAKLSANPTGQVALPDLGIRAEWIWGDE